MITVGNIFVETFTLKHLSFETRFVLNIIRKIHYGLLCNTFCLIVFQRIQYHNNVKILCIG